MPDAAPLLPEDAKLVTLARAARSRSGAAEGAAVRHPDGRTYAACTVTLRSLPLSALQAAVAAAASSGALRLEAAAVVGGAARLAESDWAVLDEMSVTTVLLADADGVLHSAT